MIKTRRITEPGTIINTLTMIELWSMIITQTRSDPQIMIKTAT
jgi:hypothetical protein